MEAVEVTRDCIDMVITDVAGLIEMAECHDYSISYDTWAIGYGLAVDVARMELLGKTLSEAAYSPDLNTFFMPHETSRRVLAHETTHYVCFKNGLWLGGSGGLYETALDEGVADVAALVASHAEVAAMEEDLHAALGLKSLRKHAQLAERKIRKVRRGDAKPGNMDPGTYIKAMEQAITVFDLLERHQQLEKELVAMSGGGKSGKVRYFMEDVQKAGVEKLVAGYLGARQARLICLTGLMAPAEYASQMGVVAAGMDARDVFWDIQLRAVSAYEHGV